MKPAIDLIRGVFTAYDLNQPDDPIKGAKLIFEALTGSGRATGRALPPRLAIGKNAIWFISGVLEKEKKSLDEWSDHHVPQILADIYNLLATTVRNAGPEDQISSLVGRCAVEQISKH